MSSNGLSKDGSLGLERSRRSTRERKQTQYFGHSGSDFQAEELVSQTLNRPLCLCLWHWLLLDVPQLKSRITIAQVFDREKERAPMTPSLVISLPLPRFISHEPIPLSPCREVEALPIKAEKKRGFELSMGSEEISDESSTPVLTEKPISKRQRLSSAKSRQENEGHSKPRGQPTVWAEVIDI